MTQQSLLAPSALAQQLSEDAVAYPSWDLTPRQLADLELLLSGALLPLRTFMDAADYRSVLDRQTLASGTFWPLPVVLDVAEPFARTLEVESAVALRDREGQLNAVLVVEEIYEADLALERDFTSRFGGEVDDAASGRRCHLTGDLRGVALPVHYDFRDHRLRPDDVRRAIEAFGWERTIGLLTSHPLHRKEFEQTRRQQADQNAGLVLHATVDHLAADDPRHYGLIKCYLHILARYPKESALLAITPYLRRGLTVPDILINAIVLQNCGCSHFMIDERDAGVGSTDSRKALQRVEVQLADRYLDDLDIRLLPNPPLAYDHRTKAYVARRKGAEKAFEAQDRHQAALDRGADVPPWFSFPEIQSEIHGYAKPTLEQGLTLFFTGLSGSGKSTIANAVLVRLMEMGTRPVTLLDGDIVRQHLSSELGFSREGRNTNIRRIGFVASEITKHGGMAICAPIAPYEETRRYVRQMISRVGGFVEIHVATRLEECERRDRKGLYARARAGIIREFTGITDPYEVPRNPELRIDTEGMSPETAAGEVITTLQRLGFIA